MVEEFECLVVDRFWKLEEMKFWTRLRNEGKTWLLEFKNVFVLALLNSQHFITFLITNHKEHRTLEDQWLTPSSLFLDLVWGMFSVSFPSKMLYSFQFWIFWSVVNEILFFFRLTESSLVLFRRIHRLFFLNRCEDSKVILMVNFGKIKYPPYLSRSTNNTPESSNELNAKPTTQFTSINYQSQIISVSTNDNNQSHKLTKNFNDNIQLYKPSSVFSSREALDRYETSLLVAEELTNYLGTLSTGNIYIMKQYHRLVLSWTVALVMLLRNAHWRRRLANDYPCNWRITQANIE